MKEIRDYIHLNIKKVVPDIDRLEQALVDDEISQTQIDCAYHCKIGKSVTVERLNGCVKDFIDTKIRLYASAKNASDQEYDKAYCRSLNVRSEFVNLVNIGHNDYVEDVVPVSIEPSSVESNEAVFIFDINLRIKLAF